MICMYVSSRIARIVITQELKMEKSAYDVAGQATYGTR